MPHQALKITGGVVQNETPALNQTGISQTQLVRLKPDPQGLTLIEKLGGWARFYTTKVTSIIRAIWGWEDTNANKWIAYGTSSSTSSTLEAIACFTAANGTTTASTNSANLYNITPQYLSDSAPAIFQTTAGSPTVTVTDSIIPGLVTGDYVYITTQVSVGGLVLYGQYAVAGVTNNTYTITAQDVFGNPLAAAYTTSTGITVTGCTFAGGSPNTLTFTYASGSNLFPQYEAVVVNGVSPSTANGTYVVTASSAGSVTVATNLTSFTYSSGGTLKNTGVVPVMSVSNGSTVITVSLPDHGYSVGSSFPIVDQTWLAGITLYGNYIVTSVINSAQFTFNAPIAAIVSPTSAPAVGFVNALQIVGGSSTTSLISLTVGDSTYDVQVITVATGTGSGATVTLSWLTPNYTFVVGETITVSGITPVAWNGSFAVTASTANSVSYANATSGSYSGGTALVQNSPFNIGASVMVTGTVNSSATPNSWNGYFVVASATAGASPKVTLTYSGNAGTWVSGGQISDNGGDVDYVYTVGAPSSTAGTGYGVGNYGVGGYGVGAITGSSATGNNIFASNWSLDNWGEVLLALPVGFTPIIFSPTNGSYQPIYYWDPTVNIPYAQIIPNAPPASNGMFVAMPQRQIIAWGSTFTGIIDPLLVRWCDVDNYNVWIAQITNQAGSFRLSTGSMIVGALQTPLQALLWTDIGIWTMQYIGPPYIYSFNQIGAGCGLIARRAMGIMDGVVYWMGTRQFFSLSGTGVSPIPCPIWDVVFQNMDQGNMSKITCAPNSLFQEVTWYYPVTNGTGENTAYITYNVMLQQWTFGTLGRSAWMDTTVLGPPIGYDPVNQYIYQHEIAYDADPSSSSPAMLSSVTTGYFALADGDNKVFVDQVWPDFKWGYYGQNQNASIQITFNAVDYPGQTPTTFGPYTVTQSTTYFVTRIRCRLISVTISSSDVGSFWRMGNLRYRVAPDGKY